MESGRKLGLTLRLTTIVTFTTIAFCFSTEILFGQEQSSITVEGTIDSISIAQQLGSVGNAEQMVVVSLKERPDDKFQAPLSKASQIGLVQQKPVEGFTMFSRLSTNDKLQGQKVRLTVSKESEHNYTIISIDKISAGQTEQSKPTDVNELAQMEKVTEANELAEQDIGTFYEKYQWQADYVEDNNGKIASGPLRPVATPDNPLIASTDIVETEVYGKVLAYGNVAEVDGKVSDNKAFVFPVDVRSFMKIDVNRIKYSDEIPAKDRIPYDKYHTVMHIANTQPVETLMAEGNIVAIAYQCIPTGTDKAVNVPRRLSVLLPESAGRPVFVAINKVRTDGKNLLIGKPGTRLSFDGSEETPLRLIPEIELWQGALDIDPKAGVILEKGTKMKLVTVSAEKPPKPEPSNLPTSTGESATEHRDSSKEKDSVILKSGEIRTGRILNESYTIKETKIETEPPGGRKAPIRIPGSNIEAVPEGNSGIIEYRRNATLTLKYSSWQVDSIVFSDTADSTDEMLMTWGDKKAGAIVMDKVTIVLSSGKEEQIAKDNIKMIKIGAFKPVEANVPKAPISAKDVNKPAAKPSVE